MNTQGWIRGYISFNSEVNKFVSFVTETIGKEFQQEVNIEIIGEEYEFTMGTYISHLTKSEVKVL